NLIREHNETVDQYNHLIESLKKEISKVIKTKEIKEAQRFVNKLESRNIQPKTQNLNNTQTFEKGDTVQLGKSIGTIIDIKGNYAQVNIDGKIVKAQTSLLEKKQPKIKQSSLNIINPQKETKELNIIGMHAFEAEIEVLQFLEYADLNNIKEIRIIHGKGSGVLKEMVRNLLKEHKLVESFSMAPPNLGGDGATVVTLK
ncbi:MAG: Smr/MutS family protein, partial [Desulfurella sp.]